MKNRYLIKNILFDGNDLCLDFINTIHNRRVDAPVDYLIDKSAWSDWLLKIGLLKSDAQILTSTNNLKEIRHLRELLYRIFYGIITKKDLLKKDIAEFNRNMIKLRKATLLSIDNGTPKEIIQIDDKNLNSYLLLILEKAHQLLMREEIKYVKECNNCGWLFLDTSKSHKRKWCNMKTCGNEVKARRHYQRIKSKKKP